MPHSETENEAPIYSLKKNSENNVLKPTVDQLKERLSHETGLASLDQNVADGAAEMELFEGDTKLSGVDKVNSNGRAVAPLKKQLSNSQSGTVNVEKKGQKDSNARRLEIEKIIEKKKQIEFDLIVE